jgi:hypothetical protein
MEAKKIAWGRKVSRPKLTKRIKKPLREVTMMERRMVEVTAALRTLSENKLTVENIQEVFHRTMYFNNLPKTMLEKKARPLVRKLARLNKLDDWTKWD